ncbi:MAG: hypothetical protein IJS19_01500 [Muribaculaceae bacterium]|nr:hypothetical protein [Muribaculaceae bacterium]
MKSTKTYDLNGNVTTLLRLYDGDAVQDAAITYDGNQLSAVYDVADDYHVGEVPQFVSDDYTGFTYDANGNLTAVDPLAEKYPDISPYASRANNPFKYVDLMGDSVTVLLNPNGAGGFGHLAILIQNNEGKWQLYSKNGYGTSSESSGEASTNDVAEGDYSSPQDFLNDDKRNPKDAKSGTRKYTEGFVIPATQTQDKKAINGAKRELKKGYNLLGSNYAKTVQTALENAGLNSGNPNKALSTIGLFGSGEYVPEMVPNAIYKNIKRYNSGFIIKPTR